MASTIPAAFATPGLGRPRLPLIMPLYPTSLKQNKLKKY
jgi:hypothetical protein